MSTYKSLTWSKVLLFDNGILWAVAKKSKYEGSKTILHNIYFLGACKPLAAEFKCDILPEAQSFMTELPYPWNKKLQAKHPDLWLTEIKECSRKALQSFLLEDVISLIHSYVHFSRHDF